MLGWLRLFARPRVERTRLLDPDKFDSTLACERSRVERAGSCFSLLTLSFRPAQPSQADLNIFSELFHQRRRATDVAGWMRDGRIGIVLPDTSHADAEVLVAFLLDALRDKEFSFTHTISMYPLTDR